MNLLKLLKNKIVFYMATRYATYGIQFITSLLIAAKLGPFYMGVWGGILLVVNYFQQINFGISHSFNILYVQHRDESERCRSYFNNSVLLLVALSVIAVVAYWLISLFNEEFFSNLSIDKYFAGICLIGVLQYFYQLSINVYRLKNRVGLVAFSQSILVILTFVSVLCFTGEALIKALVYSYIAAYLIVVCSGAFLKIYPQFKLADSSLDIQKSIIVKGWFLFLYNSCFYFIIISVRTVIGAKYSVEEFGLFTFSFTLAHAIMLLLESVQFLLFPKIIGKLSGKDDGVVIDSLHRYRHLYITLAHFLIYLAILIFPVFLYFLPSYQGGQKALNLIALTVLMNTNSIGYAELLLAKNKEKVSALISVFTLAINIGIAYFLANVLNVAFSYVILATLISYAFFSLLVYLYSIKTLKEAKFSLSEFFPLRLMVPYIVALLFVLFVDARFSFVPLLVFLLTNIKDVKYIVSEVKTVLASPNIINL